MSTVFTDSVPTWDYLLHTWRDLEVPEGWRPELTVEEIRMTPPPGGQHNVVADVIHEALVRSRPEGCGIFQTQGVGIRQIGGIYVPDLCVAPRSVIPPGSEPVAAEYVLLAVEITSRGNADHDRTKKRSAYANGSIPQYLLVDAFDEDGPAVSLFSDPVKGVYRRIIRLPFGEPIKIGEPFGVELDTTTF